MIAIRGVPLVPGARFDPDSRRNSPTSTGVETDGSNMRRFPTRPTGLLAVICAVCLHVDAEDPGTHGTPSAAPANQAVSKWRFRKDFGLGFGEPSPAGLQYAVLTFDFDPRSDGRQQGTKPPGRVWACAQSTHTAVDQHGVPIWLSSDDLMRRAVKTSELSFPMLDLSKGSHFRGVVKLDLLIGEQGDVKCAQVVSGHPIAISSAMWAIRSWRFRPFVQHDRRTAVFGRLTIPYDVTR